MVPQRQHTETGIKTELQVDTGSPDTNERKVISRTPQIIVERMASVFPGLGRSYNTKISHSLQGSLRMRRYNQAGAGSEVGDFHPTHTDWFQRSKNDTSDVLIVSMLLYLTTPEEGGSTFFPHVDRGPDLPKGYHFQAKRGNLAIWWSCLHDGTEEKTPVLLTPALIL